MLTQLDHNTLQEQTTTHGPVIPIDQNIPHEHSTTHGPMKYIVT